eukprot:CAMPEP_0115087938 /NCGR_PEP_ID=MMETSP0227-20121206/23660_1 /TAXON_ID=89957 /ORGANISM="Polarella glacialis, Strain CCMP 1383" /LENGTH=882 /DNA_ID=CAMNT_0002478045 /DNA_START=128 /DNA_END=2776 /DNA_ORIENTATION=-
MQTIIRTNDTAPKRAEGGTQKVKGKLDAFLQQGMQWPLTMFFLVACALSVCLRCLDQWLFSEEDDPGASELCVFLAFAVGVAFFMRSQQRGPLRPTRAPFQKRPLVADESTQEQRRPPRKPAQTRTARGAGSGYSYEETAVTGLDQQQAAEIVAACKRGELALAEARFAQMLRSFSSGHGLCSEMFTSSRLGSTAPCQAIQPMLEACLDAGDVHRAAAWVQMLLTAGLHPSSRSLQAVTEGLVQSSEASQAEQLLLKVCLAGAPIDATCLQLIFEHCISPEDTSRVEAWLARLKQRSHQELMAGFLAILRSKRHARSGADTDVWMHRAIEAGAAHSSHIYNAAITSCARAGDPERAERWLQAMEVAAKDEPGLKPDVISYSAIMDAFAQRGETDRTESWLQRMVAAGVCPDAVSFNTVVKAHARVGDVAGAERWLKIARERGMKLDTFGYNAVIAAAARAIDPETAEKWLCQMLEDGAEPDVISYNSVINAYAKKSDAAGALRIVNLMCQNHVEPDVVTLGVAVHACAKAGEQEKAEAVFDLILARGKTRPDAIGFNALINASVKAGDTARAELWLSKMLEAGVTPSVVSYTTMLHAHARAGDIEKTERCLELMQQNNVEANVVSYSALIHACVKAGDIARAEKWFEAMRSAGIQANTVSYSSLLNVCAKAGDYKKAERWLDDMCKDGVNPNVVCYNNVIDACAKAGQAQRAETWLWRLAGEEAGPYDDFRTPCLAPTRQSFTTAAQAHAMLGSFKEVERILHQMEDRGIAMDEFSLTVQLSAYARSRPRQRERAEATFRAYTDRGLPITRPPLRVLKSILGAPRFDKLLEEQHIKETPCSLPMDHKPCRTKRVGPQVDATVLTTRGASKTRLQMPYNKESM